MAPRVLVSETLAERGLDAMRTAGLHVDVRTGLDPEQLLDAVRGAQALVIRSATQVTAEVLEAGSLDELTERLGPSGTIVYMPSCDRITYSTAKTLADPGFREQYVTRQWFEAVGNTPEQFADYLKSEYARWERLIKLSRVTVE